MPSITIKPPVDALDIKPSLPDWTLRLKHHKTTILISTSPQTDFQIIRQQLLTILTSTHPSGEFNGRKIPSEPEDVILGEPKDIQDLRKGWVEIVIPEQEFDEVVQNGRKRKIGGKKSILNCPQGVGLKDGSALAFKFREGGGGHDNLDEMVMEDTKWDVVIPTYEDEYGRG